MELDRGFSTVKKQGMLNSVNHRPTYSSRTKGSENEVSSKISRSQGPSVHKKDRPRIWANLEQKDDPLLSEPTSFPLKSDLHPGNKKLIQRRRQSHIDSALDTIEDTRKSHLGLSTGRRNTESSYAFDHPTRELGRGTFDSSGISATKYNHVRGRSGSAHARTSDLNEKLSYGKSQYSKSDLRRSHSLGNRNAVHFSDDGSDGESKKL